MRNYILLFISLLIICAVSAYFLMRSPPRKVLTAEEAAKWMAEHRRPPEPEYKLVVPQCPKDPTAAWHYRNLVAPYLKNNERGTRWDQPAVNALNALASSHDSSYEIDSDQLRSLLREAWRAGSQDPLIIYNLTRKNEQFDGKDFNDFGAYDGAVKNMNEGKYPSFWRFYAMLRTAEYHWKNVEDLTRKSVCRDLADKALDQFETACKDPDTMPRTECEYCCKVWIDFCKEMGDDRKKAYDRIAAVLERSVKDESLKRSVEGHFYIEFAWDARGSDVASKVSDEGWKLFGGRITLAKKALEAAYTADSANVDACRGMITIAMAEGAPRPEMEKWFDRAVKIDPNDSDVYDSKMIYLLPQWGGSEKELLAFGRECFDAVQSGNVKNWTIAEYLPRCHECLWDNWRRDLSPGKKVDEYWQGPGVWDDIKLAYEFMLNAHPKSLIAHTKYMRHAIYCRQWDEYRRQFEACVFNGGIADSVFGTKMASNQMTIYAQDKYEEAHKKQ